MDKRELQGIVVQVLDTFHDGQREKKAAAITDAILAALGPGEAGWLVELWNQRTNEFRAMWWACDAGEGEPGWTKDSTIALRFAREVDAQAYIDDIGWTDAKPTEHSWSLSASPLIGGGDQGSSVAGALTHACEEQAATEAPGSAGQGSFQSRVAPWMRECFGDVIPFDKVERGDRLLEEVFELLQSGGYDPARVLALRDYVWGRDVGEPAQEVGGVMVTLAAYCLCFGLDMHEAGETELARIWTKVPQIRAKHAAKPTGSALPVAACGFAGTDPEGGRSAGWPGLIAAWTESGIRDQPRATRWDAFQAGASAAWNASAMRLSFTELEDLHAAVAGIITAHERWVGDEEGRWEKLRGWLVRLAVAANEHYPAAWKGLSAKPDAPREAAGPESPGVPQDEPKPSLRIPVEFDTATLPQEAQHPASPTVEKLTGELLQRCEWAEGDQEDEQANRPDEDLADAEMEVACWEMRRLLDALETSEAARLRAEEDLRVVSKQAAENHAWGRAQHLRANEAEARLERMQEIIVRAQKMLPSSLMTWHDDARSALAALTNGEEGR